MPAVPPDAPRAVPASGRAANSSISRRVTLGASSASLALTADHLLIIGKGKLIADTPTAEFLAGSSRTDVLVRASHPQNLSTLLTGRGARVRTEPDGALAVTGLEPRAIGDIAAAAGIGVHELTTRSASLEEAFMEITGDAVEYRAADTARGRVAKTGAAAKTKTLIGRTRKP